MPYAKGYRDTSSAVKRRRGREDQGPDTMNRQPDVARGRPLVPRSAGRAPHSPSVTVHLMRRRDGRRRAVWCLWWRDAGGRVRTRQDCRWSRREALAERDRIERSLANGAGSCPWPDFVAAYLADLGRRCRPATVAEARTVLAHFGGWAGLERLEAVTRETVARYLAARLEGDVEIPGEATVLTALRPATHNKHLRRLRAALEWAVDAGLYWMPDGSRRRERSPVRLRGLREVRRVRPVLERRATVERLIEATAEEAGPEFEAASRLAFECGLRAGEVSHLVWGSVDLAAREVCVEAGADGWVPKGAGGRLLFGDRLADVLAGLRAQGEGRPGGRIVGGARPERFERRWRRVLREASEAVGLAQPMTPHGLRRSLATILANEGIEAHQLQKVMRHSDPRTTAGCYARVDERRAAAAARARLARAR